MILTKAKIPKRQSAWRESPGTWGICSTLSKSYRGLQRWWGQSGRTGWLSPPSRRDRRSWLGRPYMEKWSKAHHMFEAPEAWAAWWEDASRQWKLSPRHTPGLQPALHFQIGLIEGNTSNKGKLYEKVHMHCTSRQRYDKLDLNNSHNLNILLLGNWAEASADDGAKNQWKEKSKSYHCQHILAGRQNNKKLD